MATPEIIKKIHKVVLDERRLKVRELDELTGISKPAIHPEVVIEISQLSISREFSTSYNFKNFILFLDEQIIYIIKNKIVTTQHMVRS